MNPRSKLLFLHINVQFHSEHNSRNLMKIPFFRYVCFRSMLVSPAKFAKYLLKCSRHRILHTTEYKAFCPFVGIGSSTPSPARECCFPPHPEGPRGKTHLLAGDGVGGPNSDKGTDTPVLYIQYIIIPLRLKGMFD
jgi:hypothetical protein